MKPINNIYTCLHCLESGKDPKTANIYSHKTKGLYLSMCKIHNDDSILTKEIYIKYYKDIYGYMDSKYPFNNDKLLQQWAKQNNW
jgi:hypothetical protein